MISAGDFSKKQIVFVFFNHGEKLSFSNDNLVVKTEEGKIKFQCTCYRLFLVFVVGNGSITTGLMQRAKKFGFTIVLLTSGLRPFQYIGAPLEGNTLLRQMQYSYDSLDLAKHITRNKIVNQREAIKRIRHKNEIQGEAINLLSGYLGKIDSAESLQMLMGYEGSASRVYFSAYFNNVIWQRRAPRTKCDMVNAVLDIGYTLLFSFVDALLSCFGFDVYCGVMHRNFYMRKSLVCDVIEPFRPLIDAQVRTAISLKQCKEDDFTVDNGRYVLKWKKNPEYISWLIKPIMEEKEPIYRYIQSYYRAFARQLPASDFPIYEIWSRDNDIDQL